MKMRMNLRMSIMFKQNFRLLFFVVAILVAPEVFPSTAYYISTTGSDSAAGSRDNPWKTFARAIPRLTPGDTLFVLDGTYDGTNGTDMLRIVAGEGAQNGTPDAYVTVKALNERQVTIKNDGGNGHFSLYMNTVSYWRVEGIRFRSQDAGTVDLGDSRPIETHDCNHLYFYRLVIDHPNRYHNDSLMYLEHTGYVTVEECEGYDFHRNGFVPWMHTTFRRCYLNSRSYPNLQAGWHSQGLPDDRGDGAFINYPGAYNIFENCISENNYIGFQTEPDYEESLLTDHNQYFGCISLNDRGAFVFSSRGNGTQYSAWNTTLENCVIINAGFAFRSVQNATAMNISVFDSGSDGLKADSGSTTHGVNIKFINSLAVNSTGYGFYIETSGVDSWSINYCNAYNNGQGNYYPPSHPNLTYSRTTNPQFGSARVYVPLGSPMKGAGQDGADIGANIIFRYKDGALTGQPLWDQTGQFPHGALVAGLNDNTSSLANVNTRLGVSGSMQLAPSAPRNLRLLP
jgi:hypothetical protein